MRMRKGERREEKRKKLVGKKTRQFVHEQDVDADQSEPRSFVGILKRMVKGLVGVMFPIPWRHGLV